MISRKTIAAFAAIASLSVTTANAGLTEWIDFDLDEGLIKVPVLIDGKESTALLDTGSNMNAINGQFIIDNGLEFDGGRQFTVIGAYGKDKRNSYNNVPVNLFGANLSLDQLIDIDVGDSDIALLLGAGFFRQFVFQIDYPNSRMRLIEHDSIDLKKSKNIRARSDKSTGMPIVNVQLNGEKDVWLLLDTGSNSGLLLNRILATSDGWLEKYGATVGSAQGVSGSADNNVFRLPEMTFGPYTVENVLTAVPAEGETLRVSNNTRRAFSNIKGKKIKGLIGYDVLKHFILTINYRKGYVHVGVPE